MKTQQMTYDVCRCYLNDYRNTLGEELYSKLSGYLRARSLSHLCTATELVDWNITSTPTLRCLMQVEALFKKNKAFSDSSVCDAAARTSFLECERLCRVTNRILDDQYPKLVNSDSDLGCAIRSAERYIAETLGNFSNFLSGLPDRIKFTSGATLTRSRRASWPHLKVRKRITCTKGAIRYVRSLCDYYGYGEVVHRITNCNRVTVVPKNWKTSRTIACEPDGNLPLQLAFDEYAKESLARKGIDLRDQSLNQSLALQGSIDGSLSTIDLSCASDLISFNTVAWLLPTEWFKFLCDIRSSHFTGVFGSGRYEKFSSMGNGSTFTLETLIFASFCKAVGSKRFSVYGDDIIIETELVPALKALLAFFGFRVNNAKSYWEGPFRESCGAHYHYGKSVTPQYARFERDTKPYLCHFVNTMLLTTPFPGQVWAYCKQLVMEHNLPLVPLNENSLSGVWISVHDAYSEKLIRVNDPKRSNMWTPSFRAYVAKQPSREVWDTRTLFLWHLDASRRSKDQVEVVRGNAVWLAGFGQLSKKAVLASSIERSTVPVDAHKYERAWVGLSVYTPSWADDGHLYGWFIYLKLGFT